MVLFREDKLYYWTNNTNKVYWTGKYWGNSINFAKFFTSREEAEAEEVLPYNGMTLVIRSKELFPRSKELFSK